MNSTTTSIKTECGNMFVTVVKEDGPITKVMADLGKSGTCAKAQLSSYCDFLSQLLTLPVEHEHIVKALTAASGHTCQMGTSCIDSLNRHIINVLENETKEDSE